MTDDTTVEATPRREGLFRRIVGRSENFDIIGKSRVFAYVTVGLVTLVVIVGFIRGLNFSIEFTGGTGLTVTNATEDFTTDDLRDAIGEAGVEGAIVQVVEDEQTGRGALITAPAAEEIGGAQERAMVENIIEVTGASEEDIAREAVGPRWGDQITRQSVRGLIVFLVLVALYLALRFEWRMAASAIVTLIHDIILTVGIYAIVGFPVSPASVIAFLTILGFSLYDTVIVFDRVAEDTARLSSVSTKTYGEVANEALNEVLLRSLSTSITALLPVGALLFVGANLLGADTLQDLALALFIGMAVGAYSSIVIATPFLVWLKEKEPRWAELKERVESRRGAAGREAPVGATAATAPTIPSTPKPMPRQRSKQSRAKRRR